MVETYLRHVVAGDGRAAIRLALDLLDRGVPFDEIVVDLLGAPQRQIGEVWLRNECTVADEHIVSGVTQRTLDALANSVNLPESGDLVVIACAEGDWHSLGSHMLAELLRWRGFSVICLGASTPADHAARTIGRLQPLALLVSCNVPVYFAGVTRLVNGAHRLDRMAPEIAEEALSHLIELYPAMSGFDEDQLARTEEDLAFITRHAAAALLVDEVAVLTDMLDWLGPLLVSRGVPAGAVSARLESLEPLIAAADARAGRLIREYRRLGDDRPRQ